MKTNRRWMNWVLEASANETVVLPWARGSRKPRARAARPARTAMRG